MAQHTPTPWHTVESDPLDHSLGQTRYKTLKIGSGRGTLDTEPFHVVADAGYSESDQVKANAAFILRAVNAHEGHESLLEGILECFTDGRPEMTRDTMDELAESIRAALAKAREEVS